MSRTFLTNLDLGQNELQNARVQNLGTAPGSPVKGQMYFNDTGGNNTLYWWDGSSWQAAKSGVPAAHASTHNAGGGDALAIDAAAGTGSFRTIGTGALQAAAGNDSRFTDSRTPSGTATGHLTGSYPGPSIANGVVTDVHVAAANKDGVAGTASMRTLGTGATQAAAGSHGHALTDAAITGVLTTAKGGTNNAGPYVAGAVMYASATTTLDDTALGVAGQTLLSGGAGVPTWGFPRTDQLVVPTAPVSFNSQKITSLADGTAATDAVNKQQLDSIAQGLSPKDSVRIASTANLGLTGLAAIDGVTPVANDRILAKDQSAPAANGIYTAASGAWTRATDMDAWAEVPGATVWVEQGTVNADTGWVSTADTGGTLGTTAITWTQNSGLGQITAGAGLTKTANTLDVGAGTGITVAADSVAVDTGTIATVASLASYVPTSRNLNTTAPITGGGTLASDKTIAITSFAGSAAGAVPVSVGGTTNFLRADGTWSAPAGGGTVNKYSVDVGGSTAQVITHNLNSRDVVVNVYRNTTPWDTVECDIERTSTTTCTLRFAVAPAAAALRAVVTG